MSDTPKPWEETWTYEDGGFCVTTDYVPADTDLIGPLEVLELRGRESNAERARLASAAPEMARLLLEVAATGDAATCGRCPFCDMMTGPLRGVAEDHLEDCRLVAVLKKAGVLP